MLDAARGWNYEFPMNKCLVPLISLLLLTGCTDIDFFAANQGNMAADSEACRSAVAEQLSRERASMTMTSEQQNAAFDQRYRFCMGQKGYDLAPVKP